MKVLLLCNYDPYNAATVSDHINAFAMYSAHDVTVFTHLVSNGGDLPDDFSLNLFDAVILHYSLFLAVDAYVSPKTRRLLKKYQGVKAIFLQDEYRFVDASVQRIAELDFAVIFTCVPDKAIEQVYPAAKLPGVRRINVLTGYVPEALCSYKPIRISRRKYDVSYRGRKYPAWHGRLGLEKWKIADKFLAGVPAFRLKCNISYKEEDRVYGSAWVNLLQHSKAVLGAESGASVFDFTGEISTIIETFTELVEPNNVDYESLRERYFVDIEDKIPLAQISPRIFEAIALRTLCILYEGDYSGVLVPWRHYVPLKKDHSNMGDVIAILKDTKYMADIISTAYAEVAMNPSNSYKKFIANVDSILEEERTTPRAQPSDDGAIRENALIQEKIDTLREKYPFVLFPNPHALTHNSLRYIKIKTKIKAVLSAVLKRRLQALIK